MLTTKQNETLYRFEELDDSARMRVICDNIDTFFVDDMNCLLEYDVDEKFPNSTIEAEYELGYVQGAGLNLYGEFSLLDLVNFAFDCREYHAHKFADADIVKISRNMWSPFCAWDTRDRLNELTWEIEHQTNLCESDAWEYADRICTAMKDLCNDVFESARLIVEDYETAEYNQDSVFDEFGHYRGMFWDYPDATETDPR